jgi:cytochrome c oxidase assembly factor CtaG
MIFLLMQAIILGFDTSILIPTTKTPLIYPYFFVIIDTQGVGGVVMWVLILFVVFIAVGFLFYALDRLEIKNKKTEN